MIVSCLHGRTSQRPVVGPSHYAPAPAERNIVVGCQCLPFSQSILSHGQLGNRLADADALTPRWVKRPVTLKVVSKSCVTWATSVPILVFLGLSVLNLGPMYATEVIQQTSDVRQHHRLMPAATHALVLLASFQDKPSSWYQTVKPSGLFLQQDMMEVVNSKVFDFATPCVWSELSEERSLWSCQSSSRIIRSLAKLA